MFNFAVSAKDIRFKFFYANTADSLEKELEAWRVPNPDAWVLDLQYQRGLDSESFRYSVLLVYSVQDRETSGHGSRTTL